ncbi:MAG: hypothetical protein NWE98_12385 [Candidatus Bathyarchaeota archaeon]|nr:hypothetical protein [Candidatus Bathyarchaeota archaeon]
MPTSDDQIKLDILFLLYKHFKDNPASRFGVDRAIIQDTLKVSEKQMDNNMTFLEEKALVALTRGRSQQWIFAKLSAEGVEVIEHMEKYAEKYSFIQNATGRIFEATPKEPTQVAPIAESFGERLDNSFKQATDQILMSDMPRGEREKIVKKLQALKKELQKGQRADLRIVQDDWVWLKKNAGMIVPAMSSVVLESVKMVLELS